MVSSQSCSRIQRRISLASPVNRGDPFMTMAMRLPPSETGFILESMCWGDRKSVGEGKGEDFGGRRIIKKKKGVVRIPVAPAIAVQARRGPPSRSVPAAEVTKK